MIPCYNRFPVKTTRVHTQGDDPKVYYHYFINFTISIAIDKAIIFKKVPARLPAEGSAKREAATG